MTTTTKKQTAEIEREEQIARLREWCPKGSTVWTILDHVSASGMSRRIRVLVPWITDKGTVEFTHPNYAVATVLGLKQAPRGSGKGDGIIVGGGGMDMGFHLVYSLAQALYGDGYALNHRWL